MEMLAKIKAYLKENGMDGHRAAYVEKMFQEVLDSELHYLRGVRASEKLDSDMQICHLKEDLEKKDQQIAELQRKLATPSESFKAQFVECAKLYLSLEECSDPYSGVPYPEYKLDIGEYKF